MRTFVPLWVDSPGDAGGGGIAPWERPKRRPEAARKPIEAISLPNPTPADEPARLAEVRSFSLVGTPSEEPYDGIVEIAAALLEMPIAVLSLMDGDRQWFKATFGTVLRSTAREDSFCRFTVLGKQPLIVEDLAQDARFADSPFVTGAPGLRFYAGVPLVTDSGHTIGTLCAFDVQPRTPTLRQIRLLERLARQAVGAMQSRRLFERLVNEVRRLAA